MRRRKRQRTISTTEIGKFGAAIILLIALGVGGSGFADALHKILAGLFVIILGAVLIVAGWIWWRRSKRKRLEEMRRLYGYAESTPALKTAMAPIPVEQPRWSVASAQVALGEIDWYQFEKLCARLLQLEGFRVERKGGAQPDGGVDLIASKSGQTTLVQCKHWRTWSVQEKVIRELLGSMTHFKVSKGALYTLKGWTPPAGQFAAEHGIVLSDGADLARRAISAMSDGELRELLTPGEHHCPKCESIMVRRTPEENEEYEPFWGCSTYPKCRGTLKHSGAK